MRILYGYFISITAFCAFITSTNISAGIPQEITEHITRDIGYVRKLNDLNYSCKQQELVIDRYVDALINKYKAKSLIDFKPEEVNNLIKEKLGIDKLQCEDSPTSSIDYKELADFISEHRRTNNPGKIKKNLQYDNYEIPIFIENDYGDKVHISVTGITKDSERPGKAYSKEAQPCLIFTIVQRWDNQTGLIDMLNSAYTACPIPRGREGTYLLNFGEALARNLGKKSITLLDESKIYCEKNNKATSLAKLKSFQEGKSWYGSHGYTPEKRIKSLIETPKLLQSFPLLTLDSELKTISMSDLNRLKENKLADAKFDFQRDSIQESFTKFNELKDLFDAAMMKFMNISKGENPQLGSFFSWQWKEDCEVYIKLIDLIFESEVTDNLKVRAIMLPRELLKIL